MIETYPRMIDDLLTQHPYGPRINHVLEPRTTIQQIMNKRFSNCYGTALWITGIDNTKEPRYRNAQYIRKTLQAQATRITEEEVAAGDVILFLHPEKRSPQHAAIFLGREQDQGYIVHQEGLGEDFTVARLTNLYNNKPHNLNYYRFTAPAASPVGTP